MPGRSLASGAVGGVRALGETRSFGDLQLDTLQASVAQHEGISTVLEADRVSFLESVVDELGAVRQRELDALPASDHGVVGEDVVLRPPGVQHPRLVGPLVRENVVSVGKEE